jgi:hypothetical protein
MVLGVELVSATVHGFGVMSWYFNDGVPGPLTANAALLLVFSFAVNTRPPESSGGRYSLVIQKIRAPGAVVAMAMVLGNTRAGKNVQDEGGDLKVAPPT